MIEKLKELCELDPERFRIFDDWLQQYRGAAWIGVAPLDQLDGPFVQWPAVLWSLLMEQIGRLKDLWNSSDSPAETKERFVLEVRLSQQQMFTDPAYVLDTQIQWLQAKGGSV